MAERDDEIKKRLMEETNELVRKWNKLDLENFTHPKFWPIITESFPAVYIDGVWHQFHSDEEVEEYKRTGKLN